MAIGDDAAPAAEGHDRRVDHLGQREDFVARIDRAAADPDHRRLAPVISAAAGLIRSGSGCGAGKRSAAPAARSRPLREQVPRHLQRDRAAAARQHLLEGARDQWRRLGGMLDALGPFQKRAQRGELVRHLVQLAAAAAE